MRPLLLTAAVALLSACGTSPMDFCHRTQDIVCDQLFTCSTEQERAAPGWSDTFGTTAGECKTKQKARLCPPDTDDRVCGFQPKLFNAAEGNACLDDLQKATCDQAATAYTDSTHCGKVCGG